MAVYMVLAAYLRPSDPAVTSGDIPNMIPVPPSLTLIRQSFAKALTFGNSMLRFVDFEANSCRNSQLPAGNQQKEVDRKIFSVGATG